MPSPKTPDKYIGPNVYTGTTVTRNRIPGLADYRQPETGKNYEIGCIWQVGKDPSSGTFGDLYMLQKIVANQGYWLLVSSGVSPTGPLLTLSDTADTLVSPDLGGNIQLEGSAGVTVTSDPMNNKLVFALTGGGIAVDSFTTDIGGPVVPTALGVIDIVGGLHSSGALMPIETDGTVANRITISSQITTATAAPSVQDNGVAHFDSAAFTVDVNGFVGLVGGPVPAIQTFTVDAVGGTGVNPVVADGSGNITITGNQVGPGVVGVNVIRTETNAPNEYEIQVQRTDTSPFSDATLNGVAHFDDAIFTADVDGFVSLVGGSDPIVQKFDVDANTPPGTDPVVADGTGVIVFSGNQVAAGTVATAIQTNSTAANSMTVEVQISSAVAATDVTKNGVAHFNSADFTVDANGFVSSTGSSGGAWQFIETQNFVAVAAVVFNTSLSNFTELMLTWEDLDLIGSNAAFVRFSSDNGATKLSGYYAPANGSYNPGPSTPYFRLFGNTSTLLLNYGSLNVQNFSGTRLKLAFCQNMCSWPGNNSTIYNSNILSSPQINWIEFSLGGPTFTGSMTMYGR